MNDLIEITGQLDAIRTLGSTLVKSGLIPKSVQTPEAAVAIMLTGRELGIGPMEAFRSINVIEGKPTISPQLMIALAERSGALADYTVTDDGQTCTVTVKRRGRAPVTASFSAADAQAMGLTGKKNWQTMPKVMRQWRAISAAFRVVFADVLAGIYIPEEMGADVTPDGEIEPDTLDAEVWTAPPAPPPATEFTEKTSRPPFAGFYDFLTECQRAKAKIAELCPDDPEAAGEYYYSILNRHGIDHSNEVADVATAKQVIKSLKEAVLSLSPAVEGK